MIAVSAQLVLLLTAGKHISGEEVSAEIKSASLFALVTITLYDSGTETGSASDESTRFNSTTKTATTRFTGI